MNIMNTAIPEVKIIDPDVPGNSQRLFPEALDLEAFRTTLANPIGFTLTDRPALPDRTSYPGLSRLCRERTDFPGRCRSSEILTHFFPMGRHGIVRRQRLPVPDSGRIRLRDADVERFRRYRRIDDKTV